MAFPPQRPDRDLPLKMAGHRRDRHYHDVRRNCSTDFKRYSCSGLAHHPALDSTTGLYGHVRWCSDKQGQANAHDLGPQKCLEALARCFPGPGIHHLDHPMT
jgi:hypothetical protein